MCWVPGKRNCVPISNSRPCIDSLDDNLTSATAQNLFHGTNISILQPFAVPISSPPFQLNTFKVDRCTTPPESFTEIRLILEVKPEPPQHTSFTASGNQITSVLNEADTWLVVFRKDPEENTRTHFAAFYSHQVILPIKTGSQLLMLMPEPTTAPATVRHAVNIVHPESQSMPDFHHHWWSTSICDQKTAPVDVSNWIRGHSMAGIPLVGGMGDAPSPDPMIFFEPPPPIHPSKLMPPMGHTHNLKMKPPHLKNPFTHRNMKHLSIKWLLEKAH